MRSDVRRRRSHPRIPASGPDRVRDPVPLVPDRLALHQETVQLEVLMSRSRTDSHRPFWVQAFYNDSVEAPKQPGALAIETWHVTYVSMVEEVEAANSRGDIGLVEFGRNG